MSAIPDKGHPIGVSVWFRGDEYQVTGPPVEYAGGTFQGAKAGEKVISVPTPEHVERRVQRNREEWRRAQGGFRRLCAITGKIRKEDCNAQQ